MGEMRSKIGETMPAGPNEERWGEVKGRVRNRRSRKRRGRRGVTRGTQSIAGPRDRAGSWAWVEGIGATLNVVAQGVARQPFARR